MFDLKFIEGKFGTSIDPVSILKGKEKVFEEIGDRSEILKNRLNRVLKNFEEIKSKNIIKNEALLEAYNYIKNNALQLLLINATQACMLTGEFNYPPFVRTLLTAIEMNGNDIIKVFPTDKDTVNILIDMSLLGDPSDYENAVRAARRAFQTGSVVGNPITASFMWSEKIYGVAREGKQISRTSNKTGKTKDITYKYEDKYAKTIELRLSAMEYGKAPFWYMIDNGNTSGVEGMEGRGGYPYPAFGPTHFVDRTINEITKLFEDTYLKFLTESYNKYRNYLEDSYKYSTYAVEKLRTKRGIHITSRANLYEDLIKDVSNDISKEIVEDLQSAKFDVKSNETSLHSAIGNVTARIETILIRGKPRKIARGTHGRFVKL